MNELEEFELEVPKAKTTVFDAKKVQEAAENVSESGTVGIVNKFGPEVKQSLDNTAQELAEQILEATIHSDDYKEVKEVLSQLGDDEVNKTSRLSQEMLTRRTLREVADGEKNAKTNVAKGLIQLRTKIVELDPRSKKKLVSRNRFLGIKIPFNIGKKVDNYLQEFKTAEAQVHDIVNALNNGKDQLMYDNAYIDEDRENMTNMMKKLEQYIYIIKQLDKKVEASLPDIEANDKMRAEDIRQEILFPIRQKSMDLSQHLAVTMQAYMALQVIKKNNEELIRGVDRTTKTTLTALTTALTVSEALVTQGQTLEIIESVNDYTNTMITQTAEQLGEQGTKIQKQATQAAINTDVIDNAFEKIFSALDSVDKFQSEALPNMQKTIDALQGSVDKAKTYMSTHRAQNANLQEIQESSTVADLDETGAVKIVKKPRAKRTSSPSKSVKI